MTVGTTAMYELILLVEHMGDWKSNSIYGIEFKFIGKGQLLEFLARSME